MGSILLTLILTGFVCGQDSTVTAVVHESEWPPPFEQTITDLDFANLTLDIVVRAIADKYRLNLFIEDGQKYRTTLRLSDISVKDALEVIADQYGYKIKISNGVVRLLIPEKQVEMPIQPLQVINTSHDSIEVNIKNMSIDELLRRISDNAKVNIILPPDIKTTLSMKFGPIPFEKGLEILLASAQLKLEKKEGIYFVKKTFKYAEGSKGKQKAGTYYLDVNDDNISLEAIDTPLETILMEIANQLALDIVFIKQVTGEVNAKFTSVNRDQVMDVLFKGTNYTYRREAEIYFIGDRSQLDMNYSRLLPLSNLKAEDVLAIIPNRLSKQVDLRLVKEHNGILAIGTVERINEIELYLKEVDLPTAQILLDVLVVDYDQSRSDEFSIGMGTRPLDTGLSNSEASPSIVYHTNREGLHSDLVALGSEVAKYIGRLPLDFYVDLQALESNGVANILSQPKIATLNGHAASISIGVTEYFKLKTDQVIPGASSNVVVTTERFEKINAEMRLNITPWVNAAREVTVEIEQIFQTPGSRPASDVPPSVSHRSIKSTVRLRDGETIILGGLIESKDETIASQVPYLGKIPFLGRLFRSDTKVKDKRELIIYVTPHLYYGNEGSVNKEAVLHLD